MIQDNYFILLYYYILADFKELSGYFRAINGYLFVADGQSVTVSLHLL